MNITGIIFSRDRAMQLDATLQSFFFHCQNADIVNIRVLYKTTDARHDAQYQSLIQEYKGQVFFKREKGFQDDLLSFLGSLNPPPLFSWVRMISRFTPKEKSFLYRLWRRAIGSLLLFLAKVVSLPKGQYVFFLVDDNIFVRNFCLQEASDSLINEKKSLGFSFRLGQNTTYCYTQEKSQKVPNLINLQNNIYSYNWTKADGDFNYPLEVSSSLYRFRDIYPLLIGLQFNNPNHLEKQLAYNARFYKKKYPLLTCYQTSVTFCNPVNIVQTTVLNRTGEAIQYTAEELSARFEQNERIKIESYDGFIPNACHQEVHLEFLKGQNAH
ncbi:MAG: hypothetical protein GY755_17575 [Chloroflexi bacterium]|nr:hypothetical protein [Chloroflexota bacterium]